MNIYGLLAEIRRRISIGGRRLTGRVALAVLRRLGESSGIDDEQRAWLLDDLRGDLDSLVEDAEDGPIIRRDAAHDMTTIRATMLWLQGRGAAPGPEAVAYIERSLATIYRRPTDRELFQRDAYLAAIGELGGDEEAESSGTITFDLTNLHGDVVAKAASSPTAVELLATYRFDEFGEPQAGNAGRFGWLGGKVRRTELVSGIIQMGARSYVPQIGRFLSVDPMAGGSANAYDYVNLNGQDYKYKIEFLIEWHAALPFVSGAEETEGSGPGEPGDGNLTLEATQERGHGGY